MAANITSTKCLAEVDDRSDRWSTTRFGWYHDLSTNATVNVSAEFKQRGSTKALRADPESMVLVLLNLSGAPDPSANCANDSEAANPRTDVGQWRAWHY